MKKPTKVTEKKTPTSFRDRLGRLFSMFTSIHTLYFFLISICMTWNVYNTYQHRVLAERQWKSEMRLAQFVSSPPARRPDEQALRRVSSRTNDSVEDLSQTMERERRYTHKRYPIECRCPPGSRGEKGERGYAGFPGEKGERGNAVPMIWNGIQSDARRDGASIRKRMSSYSQIRLLRGPPGPKGDMGPAGLDARGTMGSPGLDGLPGEKGEKGDRGNMIRPKLRRLILIKGEAGLPGMKGDAGDSIIGPRGDHGPPGLPGSTGFPGKNGRDGSKGELGYPGLPGEKGDRGRKGEPGYTTTVGLNSTHALIMGPPGPHGPKGRIGLPGQPGFDGQKGDRGDPGSQGFTGANGDVGPPGIKGEKGDHGNGVKGERGPIGLPGFSSHMFNTRHKRSSDEQNLRSLTEEQDSKEPLNLTKMNANLCSPSQLLQLNALYNVCCKKSLPRK